MKIQRDGRRLSKHVCTVFGGDSISLLMCNIEEEKMENKGFTIVSSLFLYLIQYIQLHKLTLSPKP